MALPMCATGGCVCGAVRYQCKGVAKQVTVCHCHWCQKRTGTAFGTEVVFDQAQIEWSGEVQHYLHHSDESGRWLKALFCPTCGTNLGFTLETVPGVQTIPAGTFDDTRWIHPDHLKFRYIYQKSKQSWSEIPEGAETYWEHFR